MAIDDGAGNGDRSPGVSFTQDDCELFRRYPERVHFTDEHVPPADKDRFRDVRTRLRAIANWLAATTMSGGALQAFVSSLNPNGRTAQDMWCCVFPRDAPNKSYALQVALIIGPTGAEACICLGAAQSQLHNPSERTAAERYFARTQEALRSVSYETVQQIESRLPSNVKFLTRWRRPDAASDFPDLRSWLAYAAGPEGAQAAISRHFTPVELASVGQDIDGLMFELAEAAEPLVRLVAEGVDASTPRSAETEQQPPRPLALSEFTPSELRRHAEADPFGLRLSDSVYRAAVVAVRAGKHVVLTGPPGTAKTTFAQALSGLAVKAGLCAGYVLTTATADWTTYETIGGLQPAASGRGLEFQPGHFIEAAESGKWLIIDELNRSNFDRAFGQFFTVLSGQSVILPYKAAQSGKPIALATRDDVSTEDYEVIRIASSWRIIATMNVFDKSLLFDMSYALMRRFAFIEVPSPDLDVYRQLWQRQLAALPADQQARVSRVLEGLERLRNVKDLGPALFIDMAGFASECVRSEPDNWSEPELTFQLFFSYLLPQFEGVAHGGGLALLRTLSPLLNEQLRGQLRRVLIDVLGASLPGSGNAPEIGDLGSDTEAD